MAPLLSPSSALDSSQTIFHSTALRTSSTRSDIFADAAFTLCAPDILTVLLWSHAGAILQPRLRLQLEPTIRTLAVAALTVGSRAAHALVEPTIRTLALAALTIGGRAALAFVEEEADDQDQGSDHDQGDHHQG